jgi:hypothetical protein
MSNLGSAEFPGFLFWCFVPFVKNSRWKWSDPCVVCYICQVIYLCLNRVARWSGKYCVFNSYTRLNQYFSENLLQRWYHVSTISCPTYNHVSVQEHLEYVRVTEMMHTAVLCICSREVYRDQGRTPYRVDLVPFCRQPPVKKKYQYILSHVP